MKGLIQVTAYFQTMSRSDMGEYSYPWLWDAVNVMIRRWNYGTNALSLSRGIN